MYKKLISTVGLSLTTVAAHSAKQPNIIVFLVDDMGLMDTSVPFVEGANGQAKKCPLNDFYRTPGMERLAKQGIRFGRFYANSVCSPTRATLLTGQSSARHHTTQWIAPRGKNLGPKDWNWDGLTKSSITLPRLLQAEGYRTIHCGKGHFAPKGFVGADPLNLGYDVNIGGSAIGQPGSYYGEKNYGKGGTHPVPGLEKYHGTNTFLTEAITIEAKAAISDAVVAKKPFYLAMSHYALHAPFHSDPRFIGNYKDSGKNKRAQAYASLVEGMDKSLNDLIDHLIKEGVAEDTFIMFLGDNGSDAPLGKATAVASSAPLKGKKGTCYEGGMRVPFIAAWAKADKTAAIQKKYPVTPGFVSSRFATVEDVFPTVLKMTGVKSPKGYKVDGNFMGTLFNDSRRQRKQEFLMHFPHNHNSSQFTVFVDGSWKIIYFYRRNKGPKFELYNLEKDPFESKDLAASNPEKGMRMVKKMMKALDDADAQYFVEKNGTVLKPTVK